ncbi:MAG: beta-ketoacyl-[acyl-carrier-protein] synthase family protein [Verrucomicrobiota bacterium]
MPSSLGRKIAVTGWGCVSALGPDTRSTWTRLIKSEFARAPITVFPTDGCRVTEGAEAHLPALPQLSDKSLSRLSRASRLALPAAQEALAHAGLLNSNTRCSLPRLEMSLSTTANGMELGEAFVRNVWNGPSAKLQTARVARYQSQQQASDLQNHLGFSGPATIVSNACSGGANSIGHAADLIRSGLADIVLTGGYDILCELVFVGFDSLQSLAPEKCRPFDRTRNGLMLGEGAGFLVLESESHAQNRGATILASLAGYGHSTDLFHLTQPAADGAPMERAIRTALRHADLPATEIGYINAHGTGTPFNDRAEMNAFSRVFGDALPQTRLSSTKAAIGHTLGAAGCIEAVFALQTLQSGQIPPQIFTTQPEELVASSLAQPNEHLTKNAVLTVNLGFGGSNAALVFTKP